MLPRPQFSTRLLLFVMASCSLAFASWAAKPHIYVVLAASMIPVFWVGAGCVFLGSLLVTHGDAWSLPSAMFDVTGAILCLIAVFGAVFYTAMLALVGAMKLLSALAVI